MANDTYTVTRSITVAAPPERVFEQVVNFRHWVRWSPWEDLDPALNRRYSGPDSGAGAGYQWSGNRRAGQGQMEITEAVEPTQVRIDLRFEKPWKAHNVTVFTISPTDSGSHVTWSMTGTRTFLTKVMGLVKSMDSMMGPDFEKGLVRLRDTVEDPHQTVEGPHQTG